MLRKMISLLLILVVYSTNTLCFATNSYSKEGTIIKPLILNKTENNKLVTLFYDYSEDNSYEEKGESFRVSETMTTGSEGGQISISKSVEYGISFSISANKEIINAIDAGISFELNKSMGTELGYEFSVGSNKTAYISATPVFNVSMGTLKTYRGQRLIKTEEVTIKSPQYYIYKLEEN